MTDFGDGSVDTLSAEEKKALLVKLLRERMAVDPAASLPLSYGQKAFWFLHKLVPETWAFHVLFSARVCSPLDREAFDRAVQSLVDRHPILKTTYIMRGREPAQRIGGDDSGAVRWVNVSDADEQAVLQMLEQDAHQPFDLERGPICRVAVYTRSATEHYLSITLPHIAIDGWSLWVCLDELRELYRAAVARTEPRLPPLSRPYSDVVRWEDRLVSGPEGEASLEFWQRRLAALPGELELLTDKRRPASQAYRGRSHRFRLSPELTRRLKTFAHEQGATLYMTLLAAFQVLLHRYTGQKRFPVGSPAARRGRAEFARTVGYLANPVVLTADLSGNPSFSEHLINVRNEALSAFENQDYPFPALVERLAPNRDPSRSPIFQTMFVLQKPQLLGAEGIASFVLGESDGALSFGGLTLKPLPFPIQQQGQFDLTLNAVELVDSISASFDYSIDLFELQTIKRMTAHFENLLLSIVEVPTRTISALDMITESERRNWLSTWNRPSPSPHGDDYLTRIFEKQVDARPDAIAVTYEDEDLSYAELNRRSNQIARHLRAVGVRAECFVGILVQRSIHTITAILGILKAGGAYVPLDPAYPEERISLILKDAHATVVLTERELAERLHGFSGEIVCLDNDAGQILQQSNENLQIAIDVASAAYVIYTSGSTGTPKGVTVTHANVARLFSSTEQWFDFTARDVWSLFHSYAFDFSVWEIWGALLYGGRLVIVPFSISRSPVDFHAVLINEGVTVLNQTPSAFKQLSRVDEQVADSGAALSLRLVIFGGEALGIETLRPWIERHGDQMPRLVNMYGITETTVHVTYRPISAKDLDPSNTSPIGVPIPDLQVYVLDEYLNLVPPGVPGELFVGGAGLARGYLNRPALTAERFVPDPLSDTQGSRLYRSGDLAAVGSDGSIGYLGRIDRQVKVRGYRIELSEIELTLCQHPGVDEAVVIAHKDESHDQRLVAYARIASSTQDLGIGALREFARSKLPEYMIPAAFIVLDAMPLTPNGKLDRNALPEPVFERQSDRAYVAAESDFERVVSGIWEEVLGIEKVGVYDSFFDLGGNSLLLTQVHARLLEVVDRPVSIIDLFRYPTTRALAAAVSEQQMPPVLHAQAPNIRSASTDTSGRARLRQRRKRATKL